MEDLTNNPWWMCENNNTHPTPSAVPVVDLKDPDNQQNIFHVKAMDDILFQNKGE